jgi:hypothetical protein
MDPERSEGRGAVRMGRSADPSCTACGESIDFRLVRRICDSATETAAAAKHLARHGVVRRDEIEPLPAEIKAFWIKNRSGIIQLISASE